MKTLIIGKNGQVGYELNKQFTNKTVSTDRSQLDLLNPDAIQFCIKSIKPDLIIIAAAYTAVDRAEEEGELAFQVNSKAPQVIAQTAEEVGAAVVYYSTDYVFDGTKNGAYNEEDHPCPIGVYGKSKLEGEKAVQAYASRHLILRTSWVYGERGSNFFLTMLRLAKTREVIKVVNDQWGVPNWCGSLAFLTKQMVEKALQKDIWGLYHLSATGRATWYDFAKEILGNKKVIPITTQEFPTPAKRPVNSELSVEKAVYNFGLEFPLWVESFKKFTIELQQV